MLYKNDKNDAIAIAEAAGRPGIRAVAVKTVEQQNLMMIHGLRQQAVQTAHTEAQCAACVFVGTRIDEQTRQERSVCFNRVGDQAG